MENIVTQVTEMARFRDYVLERFAIELDDNQAAKVWIHLFADEFRRGTY